MNLDRVPDERVIDLALGVGLTAVIGMIAGSFLKRHIPGVGSEIERGSRRLLRTLGQIVIPRFEQMMEKARGRRYSEKSVLHWVPKD